MPQDAAQLVLQLLQNDSNFCSLVTGGAGNILSTGDMLVEVLNNAEQTRRDEAATNVLGVSVQDGGEVRLRGTLWRQPVIVRPLDRLNGFDAIRAVRFSVIALLDETTHVLDEDAIVRLTYQARSGHRVDRIYNVDFEAVTFDAIVEKEDLNG